MPLPYRKVLEKYDRARAFGETRSLPEYASKLNELTGTDLYNEGLRDGPWTRFSTRADQFLGPEGDLPIGGLTGELGAGIGSMFGHEEAGRSVGEGLPRTLIQAAPLMIPGLGEVYGGTLAAGLTGAAFAGQTYADTGNTGAAAISGLGAAAMPYVGKFSGALGSKLLGDGAGRFAGSQLGMAGTNLASTVAQAHAQGQDLGFGEALGQPEFWLNQIPFTVYDAVMQHGVVAKPREQFVQKETKPFVPPENPDAEQTANVDAFHQNLNNLINTPGVTGDQLSAATGALIKQVSSPGAAQEVKNVVQAQAGTSALETPVTIWGRYDKTSKGTHRVLIDDFESPQEIGLSKGDTVFVNQVEPKFDEETGRYRFDAKVKNLGGANYKLNDADFGVLQNKVDETQPDLSQIPLDRQGQQISDAAQARTDSMGEVLNERAKQTAALAKPSITSADAAGLTQMGVEPQRIMRLVNTIPKSKDLVLDMFQGKIQEDAQGNVVRLGNTDVGAGGWMGETRFVKTTQIPQDLLPALKEAYPEAFNDKGEVNATALVKGLKERPMVEVKKFDKGSVKSEGENAEQLTHELDTRYPGWVDRNEADMQPEELALVQRFYSARGRHVAEDSTKYSFLGPKSEQNMPGYVEGLVRVPWTSDANFGPGQKLYSGPHFGAEDTNVLAFFRGYEETLSDGKKAFHVIEVQSDWGQKVRDEQSYQKEFQVKQVGDQWEVITPRGRVDGPFRTEGQAQNSLESLLKSKRQGSTPSSPLLSSYETLALKAAVDHARSVGADFIDLSDAQTAMMTEGHDKVSIGGLEQTREEAIAYAVSAGAKPENIVAEQQPSGKWAPRLLDPVQAQGMRLHYDVTLPSALTKLTGERGEKWEGGVHKATQFTDMVEGRYDNEERAQRRMEVLKEIKPDEQFYIYKEDGQYIVQALRGSPIFRNPDGTPKSNITVRRYSLDKINSGLSQDDTLSIKEAVQKYEQSKQREQTARDKIVKPIVNATDWEDVVGSLEKVKKSAQDSLDKGANPTQALETERLKAQAPEVDAAMADQNATSKSVKNKLDYAKRVEAGHLLIQHYTNALESEESGSVNSDIGSVIVSAMKRAGTAPDQKVMDRMASAVLKWQSGEYGPQTPEKLAGALNTVLKTANRKPSKTKESYMPRDERVTSKNIGEYIDMAEGESPENAMERFIDSEGKREEGFKVQKNSKGRPSYIGKDVGEAETSSLNVKVGSGTTEVGDLASIGDVPTGELPKVSRDAMLDTAKRFLADPTSLAEDVRTDQSSPGQEHVEDVKEQLDIYVKVKSGQKVAGSKADIQEAADNVDYWIRNYRENNAEKTLGSQVPGDEKLAREAGLYDGFHAALRHLSNRGLGIASDWARAVLNSGILPNYKFRLPGMEGHDATVNYFMPEGSYNVSPEGKLVQDEPFINLRRLPPLESEGKSSLNQWYIALAHELFHPTELHLGQREDPAAMQYKEDRDVALKALRETKAVPKKVRALVKQTLEDKHFAKLRSGEMKVSDIRKIWSKALGNDFMDYFSYVYAMQHPREMMATMFSDPHMTAIAEETQMGSGKSSGGVVDNVLTWLSKAYAKVTGAPENALSFLAKSYDNYLAGGVVKKGYSGAGFIRDSLLSQGVKPEALASRMQTVDRTYARGTLEASITGFNREVQNGLLPGTSEVGNINKSVEAALRSSDIPSVFDSTMSLLAHELPVHQELLWRMKQDIEIASNLVAETKTGKVPWRVAPGMEKELSLSKIKLDKMDEAMKKQSLAMARFNNLDRFSPEGWEHSVAQGLTDERIRNVEPPDEVPDSQEVRKLVALDKVQGKNNMNFLAKTFMLTSQLKEIYPKLKTVLSGVFTEQGLAHSRATTLNGAKNYNPTLRNVDKEILKSNNRVAESKTLSEAVSDLARWQNKEGGGQMLDMKDDFVKDTLSRFNDTDRAAILQSIKSQQQRHHAWSDIVLPEAMGNINVDNTAMLIAARSAGMLPDQARKISEGLYNGLRLLVDPAQSAVGAQMLKETATQMDPMTYVAALQHAQGMSEKTANWINRVKDNPGYTTEQRYGTDKLVMLNPNGEKGVWSGERVAMDKKRMSLEAKDYTLLDYVRAEDMNRPNFGMREDTLNALDQLDAQNEVLVSELLKDQPELAAKILPRIQRAGDVRSAIAAASPLPAVKRNFAEGRESINMLNNADQFYTRMNNWIRNRSMRARSALDMLHPEIDGNAELRKFAQEKVDSFLTPDNPTARKFVETIYFYKLGFDLGNSMLEMTQNLTTGMSALISETGSVSDAFGLWGKALKEIGEHRLTGKWKNPEIQKLYETAQEYGHQGLATWSDIVDPDVNTVLDSSAGTATSPFGTIKNAARRFTTYFTRFNDLIALHSGYNLAREQGMTPEQARSFAFDLKQRGLFTGGKAQRPGGLWSIKTKPVPQLISALQTYSIGWFGQMAENYVKGFGKAPEGLTETQRLGAKKAFIYSLVSQAALAGVLGLPGVGQGMALLNQSTGLDLKGWLRQNLAKSFGEDQAYGGILTSLALRGVGAGGLPFDPSGRASVSVPFLGVDAYKGFSVGNLGGAVGSTTEDFVKGLLGMLGGDPTAASKILPNVAKRPFDLWRGEGDVRDARGGLQTQLSPAERFMMAGGITPTRVQTNRDLADAVDKANKAAVRQKETFVDGLAELTRKGNVAEVQKQLATYHTTHPDENIKNLVQSVSSRVVAQTQPYDYRQNLNPGVQLQGLTPEQPFNSADRLRQKTQTESTIGGRQRFNFTGERKANLIDQSVNSGLYLTPAEAAQHVPGKRPTPSPYTWLNN